jgi:hypothetical protein
MAEGELMSEERKQELRRKAVDVFELTKGYTPEQREYLRRRGGMFDTMEELAGYVLELTSS